MESLETTFNALFKIKHLDRFDPEQALSVIGELTDISLDLRRIDGLDRAVEMGEELLGRELTGEHRATLHYFLANNWANRRALLRPEEVAASGWLKPGIAHEITHLRAALDPETRDQLPEERVGQMLTNLGNSLSQMGRFAEAVEAWDQSREASPSSPLTRGNRGLGLVWYARALYDPAQANIILRHAYRELGTALRMPLHDDAKGAFEHQRRWIESAVPRGELDAPLNLDAPSVGDTDEERRYAWWCLDHRLFLNPLNDLGRHAIGAGDVLAVPGQIVGSESAASFAETYASLAESFAEARHLQYATSTQDEDADLQPVTQAAGNVLHGIAGMLNDYFGLDIPDDRLSLSSLWHLDQQVQADLRPPFHQSTNWPLEGLFWLSKELTEQSGADAMTVLQQLRSALLYLALAIHQQEAFRRDHAQRAQ